MDGYAVLAKDLAGAKRAKTGVTRLIGRSAAGEIFNGKLSTGQRVRIFTGSALPAGADAVVMQEDTRLDSKRQNEVLFPRPRRNPGKTSGSAAKTSKAARPSRQVGKYWARHNSACWRRPAVSSQVKVAGRPSVALVATGSELSEAGSSPALEPGRIYESNRAALAPLVEKAGGEAVIFPIVREEPEATRAALAQAFEQCDIVLTCGGVSVGEMDFVKSAFEELGGSLEFWKVAIRPGRPFVFGRYGNKFLFGLLRQSRFRIRDFSSAGSAGVVALARRGPHTITVKSRRPCGTIFKSWRPPAFRASAIGCGRQSAPGRNAGFAHSEFARGSGWIAGCPGWLDVTQREQSCKSLRWEDPG